MANVAAFRFRNRVPINHKILTTWYCTQMEFELLTARKAFLWDLIQAICPIYMQGARNKENLEERGVRR
jgi:hypothetical protein